MDRRTILKSLGGATVVVLAGCSSNDGDEDESTQENDDNQDESTQDSEPTFNSSDADYPSYSGTVTISGDDDFWSFELDMSDNFTLSYTVTNNKSDSLDFDVFVFNQEEYDNYIETVQGNSSSPDAIDSASSEGVRTSASKTVDLDAGTYYFVVDNTDIGDAGDWGSEETREVQIEFQTGEPSESTSTPTSTPQQDIQQIASESYTESGLATHVSDSGDTILFGFGDGNVMIFDDDREGDVISLNVDRAVSDLQISDDENTAAIGWIDADAYSLLDLTENDGPTFQHPGLWDIDMTPDGTAIASISQPLEGTGSVGLMTDGSVAWETAFEDSAGSSVAVSADGSHIAVGTTEYWTETEPQGTTGVKLYDGNGTEQWTHETETAAISVNIDGSREIVVAGTDGGKTIVLDMEGEVVWETEEYGGYVFLSDDGSTIVTGEPAGLLAVDAESGDERWTADEGGLAFDQISVSDGGDRALAAFMSAGEVLVVEDGDAIWEESYDVGPVAGALSSDGGTWSVIVQNNDEQTAEVEIYRDV